MSEENQVPGEEEMEAPKKKTPRKKTAAKKFARKAARKAAGDDPAGDPGEGPAAVADPKPDAPQAEAGETGNADARADGAKQVVRDARTQTAEDSAGQERSQERSHDRSHDRSHEDGRDNGQEEVATISEPPGPEDGGGKKRRRRRRKGSGGGEGDSAATPRVNLDPDEVARKAWKIYLAEVSEDGLALIGDNEARELSRRSFRIAEVFLEEQARRGSRG